MIESRPSSAGSRRTSFAALRELRRAEPPPVAEEKCELCSISIGPAHRHLLELEKRQIVCACDPCALRFENVIGGRFKLVPRDARMLADFQMTDAEWENFHLPIHLAFFFYSTPLKKMTAMYPSPAGATESLLQLTAWKSLAEKNPLLAEMQPDVEALLANRTNGAREYFLAPIDKCYELVGTIRMHWRGLSGGEEAWSAIGNFFTELKSNARS